MAECIKKLCHKAFSVPTLPRTTAAVKEPKVADFEPNSASYGVWPTKGSSLSRNNILRNQFFHPA